MGTIFPIKIILFVTNVHAVELSISLAILKKLDGKKNNFHAFISNLLKSYKNDKYGGLGISRKLWMIKENCYHIHAASLYKNQYELCYVSCRAALAVFETFFVI